MKKHNKKKSIGQKNSNKKMIIFASLGFVIVAATATAIPLALTYGTKNWNKNSHIKFQCDQLTDPGKYASQIDNQKLDAFSSLDKYWQKSDIKMLAADLIYTTQQVDDFIVMFAPFLMIKDLTFNASYDLKMNFSKHLIENLDVHIIFNYVEMTNQKNMTSIFNLNVRNYLMVGAATPSNVYSTDGKNKSHPNLKGNWICLAPYYPVYNFANSNPSSSTLIFNIQNLPGGLPYQTVTHILDPYGFFDDFEQPIDKIGVAIDSYCLSKIDNVDPILVDYKSIFPSDKPLPIVANKLTYSDTDGKILHVPDSSFFASAPDSSLFTNARGLRPIGDEGFFNELDRRVVNGLNVQSGRKTVFFGLDQAMSCMPNEIQNISNKRLPLWQTFHELKFYTKSRGNFKIWVDHLPCFATELLQNTAKNPHAYSSFWEQSVTFVGADE